MGIVPPIDRFKEEQEGTLNSDHFPVTKRMKLSCLFRQHLSGVGRCLLDQTDV